MKIDLRRLYGFGKLTINEEAEINPELYHKMNVNNMDKVKIEGEIIVNYENNIEINLDANGKFIMPSEISGDDVEVPFNTHIEEEILENSLNNEFYLDLSDILWENIVLEIPFKVIKKGEKIECQQGEGWQLSEE